MSLNPRIYHFFVFYYRETIKKLSTDLLCQAYKQIYEAIMLASNDYKEPLSIVPRSPDQVVKLLDL